MEKRQTYLKHGVLKSNCAKNKKKLHQVLRKISDEQKSDFVKANSSKTIDTRIETASDNKLGKLADLLSQNFKLVGAKSVKGKSSTRIKLKNEASPIKDVNCVNGARKTLKKKINIGQIKFPPLPSNERTNNVDHDNLFPGKVNVKQQKSSGKAIKKSVIKGYSHIVEENFQGNCFNEFPKEAQSIRKKNCKSFLHRSNLMKIDSPDVPSCKITVAQRKKNIIATTNGVGKKSKGRKLLNKNIRKVSGKEVPSSTIASLETSLKGLEGEIENSLQMCSEMNENNFESMSSPICVEMHGKIDAASNLFNNSIQRYQMPAAKRVVCEKEYMTWMQSNIPTSNQWKVYFGKVERQTPWNTDANQLEESVLDRKMTGGEISKETLMNNHDNISSYQSAFQLIKLSEKEMLMVLYPHQTALFWGMCNLRVLWGSVEVLGYRIHNKNRKKFTIHSPWDFNMLGIHAIEEFQYVEEDYYDILEKTVLTESKFTQKIEADMLRTFPKFSSLILFKSVPKSLSKFLEKYISECFESDILVTVEKKNRIHNGIFFNPCEIEESKIFKEKKEWIDISNYFMQDYSDCRKIMVCGGKGVGKSSFLRFLVNRMMSTTREILYIDLDPGQCEFTPPGCVSAVIVRDPLLGPNFTHLIHPKRCIFIGRVDVSKCPLQYMQSVELLLEECTKERKLCKIPWVINTMGFSRGVGVDLTIASIKLVYPTDVIQIESSRKSNNFPFELVCSRVNAESVDSFISRKGIKVKYDFHTFLSSVSSHGRKSLNPSKLREITVLAYFSKSISSDLSLLKSPVHVLPFETLKLCICHENINYSFYLSAMNANVVALCNVGDRHGLLPTDPSYPEIWTKTPISDCYGMGIVRGVDMKRKKIFIISPLPSTIIQEVNCLALGAVYLPEKVYTKQKGVEGFIPYVTEGTGLAKMVNN